MAGGRLLIFYGRLKGIIEDLPTLVLVRFMKVPGLARLHILVGDYPILWLPALLPQHSPTNHIYCSATTYVAIFFHSCNIYRA